MPMLYLKSDRPPIAQNRRRVAIVDCSTLAAQTLAVALQSRSEFEVVWIAHCLPDAHRQLRRKPCDLMLVDVEMDQGAWCFIDQITRTSPDVKLVVLTMNGCDAFIHQASDAGAAGYVLKRETLQHVVGSLRRVASGEACFPEGAASRSHRTQANGGPRVMNGKLSGRLTPRQLEVLTLVAKGATAKGISRSLNLSVKGVNSHIYRIMDKLNVHNRVELARIAIRDGLIAP